MDAGLDTRDLELEGSTTFQPLPQAAAASVRFISGTQIFLSRISYWIFRPHTGFHPNWEPVAFSLGSGLTSSVVRTILSTEEK